MDYGEVHRSARGIVEAPPVRLTETVAERIASGTVDQHPEVEAVRRGLATLTLRLDGTVLDGSAVEILRRREARS